jgi:hypothetical protein
MAEETFEKPAKLPVWSTVVQSYVLTFKNLGWFVKMAWVWLVVFLAVCVAVYWYAWPHFETAGTDKARAFLEAVAALPTSLLSVIIISSFAITWHRLLLLGETNKHRSHLRFDRTFFRYFGWVFLFSYIWLAPVVLPVVAELWLTQDVQSETDTSDHKEVAVPGANVDSAKPTKKILIEASNNWGVGWLRAGAVILVIMALTIMLAYVPARLSLLLPAIALGHNLRPIDSWRLTSGNFCRLFMGALLTAAVLSFCFMSIELFIWSLSEPETRAAYVIQRCFQEFSNILVSMTGITFLSLAYRHFVGMPAQPSM